MRSKPVPRLLRSAGFYVFIGAAMLALVGVILGSWAYENNSWVRFHVQDAYAQVRGLVVKEPVLAPTAVNVAAAPTFAPPPTLPPTATATASPTDLPGPTPTTAPTATPTASPTPLPPKVTLTGFRHEYQLYNNCGPTTTAIDLSYWGWTGTQKTAAAILKPNQDDKNVTPREIYEYALTQGYDAYIRVDGDVDTLKRFLAAGYPVVVEKGFTCAKGERCSGWFGHYSTFSGYDDAEGVFILQDSFRGPNLKMTYTDVVENWRSFNYLYVVLFPAGPDNDAKIQQLLGPALDVEKNYRDALARAQDEALTSTGEAASFAWFNVGTNLTTLKDYAGAAAAFDQARQIGLPYRMLWYQFGPYLAYYYMGRYQDVVDLATFAIDSVTTVPGLEEAYYWRGLSEIAIGQPDQAEKDFRTALLRRPGYKLAIEGLAQLGLTP
jgi:tetratricopeptide (TPR) repeat protein